MATKSTSASTGQIRSGLAAFVLERYDRWAENRQELEEKWDKNIQAYQRLSGDAWAEEWKEGEGEGWRSTTFFGIIKEKVTAAFAVLVDMLLQGGKIPFLLKDRPEFQDLLEDMPPEVQEVAVQNQEGLQKRMEGQLARAQADRVLAKNILAGAIYGETYAKFSVDERIEKGYRLADVTGTGAVPTDPSLWRFEEQARRQSGPGFSYVSVYDVFRDLEEENLQASAGWIHRDYISPFKLRQQAGKPYYLKTAIKTALEEARKAGTTSTLADDTASLRPLLRDLTNRQNTIRYLEFWGRVPRRLADEFEASLKKGGADLSAYYLEEEVDSEGDEVEVMICVADETVVRYARVPAGERPLFRTVWEDPLDDVSPVGVADNLEQVQHVLNGAIRCFEDNKRLASDVILAYKLRYLDYAPKAGGRGEKKGQRTGPLHIYPGMGLPVSEECPDARMAVQQIVVEDVGQSLLSLIDLFLRFSDDESNIPRVEQGAVEKGGQTAFEVSRRLEKSSKYMGMVIRNYDEYLLEPELEWLLDYNMRDPENPFKGDFQVEALGFSSYQDRIDRLSKLTQALQLAVSHPKIEAEVRFRKLVEALFRSLEADPDEFLKSNEEKAAEAQQPNPVAMLEMAKAESEIARNQADAASKSAAIKSDQERLEIERARAVADIEGRRKAAEQKQNAPGET